MVCVSDENRVLHFVARTCAAICVRREPYSFVHVLSEGRGVWAIPSAEEQGPSDRVPVPLMKRIRRVRSLKMQCLR